MEQWNAYGQMWLEQTEGHNVKVLLEWTCVGFKSYTMSDSNAGVIYARSTRQDADIHSEGRNRENVVEVLSQIT